MVGGKLGDNVNYLWGYFVQIEFSLGLELLANQDFLSIMFTSNHLFCLIK